MLNQQSFPTLGLSLISVYSGFGLDRIRLFRIRFRQNSFIQDSVQTEFVYSGFGLDRIRFRQNSFIHDSVQTGFGLFRIRFRQDSVYSGFGLDRIRFRQDSVYSGFGLDRIHCIIIVLFFYEFSIFFLYENKHIHLYIPFCVIYVCV